MPTERDWTRRDILKTAAAGGLVSAFDQPSLPSPASPRPPIPSGFAARTSTRAPATG